MPLPPGLPSSGHTRSTKTAFFTIKKAAEKHLSETVVKVDRGEYLELKKLPTFAQAAELWYDGKTDRGPSCVADIRTRLDKHILPLIGSFRLDKINVANVEKLRDGLRKQDYAPRAINTIIRIIGAAAPPSDVAKSPPILSNASSGPSWPCASCAAMKKPPAPTTPSAQMPFFRRTKSALCSNRPRQDSVGRCSRRRP
jgi:hypothetical protein